MSKDAETPPEADPDDIAADDAPETADDAPETADDAAAAAADADAGPAADDDADVAAEGVAAGDVSAAPEPACDLAEDAAASDAGMTDEADADADAGADVEADAEAGPDVDAVAPGAPFKLHSRARLEETEALLAWLNAAPADAPMEFDASGVENISTPYVLAIVGAARARAEAGSPAAVRSPSPEFVDAFSDLGLFGDLMKMEIRP